MDNAATEAYAEREPIAVASVDLGGTRTLMIVPMLKDNELVGAFTLARREVRPFTDLILDHENDHDHRKGWRGNQQMTWSCCSCQGFHSQC